MSEVQVLDEVTLHAAEGLSAEAAFRSVTLEAAHVLGSRIASGR